MSDSRESQVAAKEASSGTDSIGPDRYTYIRASVERGGRGAQQEEGRRGMEGSISEEL